MNKSSCATHRLLQCYIFIFCFYEGSKKTDFKFTYIPMSSVLGWCLKKAHQQSPAHLMKCFLFLQFRRLPVLSCRVQSLSANTCSQEFHLQCLYINSLLCVSQLLISSHYLPANTLHYCPGRDIMVRSTYSIKRLLLVLSVQSARELRPPLTPEASSD